MNIQHYEKNISEDVFNNVIGKLKEYPDCKLLSEKLGRDNGHFHSYKFLSDKGKFSMHYDTKAKQMQINAPDEIRESILEIACSLKSALQKTQEVQKQAEKPMSMHVKASPKKQAENGGKTLKPPLKNSDSSPAKKESLKEKNSVKRITDKHEKRPDKPHQKAPQITEAHKDIVLSRLDSLVEQKMARIDGLQVVANTPTVTQESGQKKAIAPKPKTKTAVSSNKTYITAKKSLSKEIPHAFDFLSENSVIQIYDTQRDLLKSNLSNYSGFLLAPFTVLEYLISFLQKKERIGVKVLGQAFCKNGESYILKPAIGKKIDSIIVIEVITALYNEYYKRHKIVHAHASHGATDIVADKTKAKEIFSDILRVINYNCKKLLEIGYIQNQEGKE